MEIVRHIGTRWWLYCGTREIPEPLTIIDFQQELSNLSTEETANVCEECRRRRDHRRMYPKSDAPDPGSRDEATNFRRMGW